MWLACRWKRWNSICPGGAVPEPPRCPPRPGSPERRRPEAPEAPAFPSEGRRSGDPQPAAGSHRMHRNGCSSTKLLRTPANRSGQ